MDNDTLVLVYIRQSARVAGLVVCGTSATCAFCFWIWHTIAMGSMVNTIFLNVMGMFMLADCWWLLLLLLLWLMWLRRQTCTAHAQSEIIQTAELIVIFGLHCCTISSAKKKTHALQIHFNESPAHYPITHLFSFFPKQFKSSTESKFVGHNSLEPLQ